MDNVFIKQAARGLLSRMPGLYGLLTKGRGLETLSARYCYSAWLRILRAGYDHGGMGVPHTIVELGPGSSLGIGLAALLSGVDKYYAFDVGEYVQVESNLKILDELLVLFEERAPIPDDVEFPEVIPKFEDYGFPGELLTEERLSAALNPQRVESLRTSLREIGAEGSRICYVSDAEGSTKLKDRIQEPIDFVYSVAVMEHVDDVEGVYGALDSILEPGQFAMHAIDYRSHGSAAEWNGHWAYSDFAWWILKGRRPLINRSYHSQHIKAIEAGNEILWIQKREGKNTLSNSRLPPLFRSMDEEDLTTSTAFVLAKRSE
jgi:hypothetical protein